MHLLIRVCPSLHHWPMTTNVISHFSNNNISKLWHFKVSNCWLGCVLWQNNHYTQIYSALLGQDCFCKWSDGWCSEWLIGCPQTGTCRLCDDWTATPSHLTAPKADRWTCLANCGEWPRAQWSAMMRESLKTGSTGSSCKVRIAWRPSADDSTSSVYSDLPGIRLFSSITYQSVAEEMILSQLATCA